jgi:hypothetical protein
MMLRERFPGRGKEITMAEISGDEGILPGTRNPP